MLNDYTVKNIYIFITACWMCLVLHTYIYFRMIAYKRKIVLYIVYDIQYSILILETGAYVCLFFCKMLLSIYYLNFLVNQCLSHRGLACFSFHVIMDPTSFLVRHVYVEFTVPGFSLLAAGFHPEKQWDLWWWLLLLPQASALFSKQWSDSAITAKNKI